MKGRRAGKLLSIMGATHYFGAGGETNFTLATLVVLVLFVVLILILPRRSAFIPVLVAAILVPSGEQIVVGGLHFPPLRIVLLVGWVRLCWLRSNTGRASFRWTIFDRIVLAYCIANALMFCLLWQDVGALVNRFGFLWNALGVYFFMRWMVRDGRDLDRVSKTLTYIAMLLAVCMIREQMTGRNVFSLLGGVPELTAIRDGHLRSQGPFAHTLIAGTMGAILFPLSFGLWWQGGKSKWLAALGCLASVAIVVSSASSTPILVLVGSWFALAMWPLRKHLRLFRWCAVCVLVGLHLAMKAPVWALIGRIDLTGSSSSYHRFELVDQFIRRFGEWWLVGTRGTYNWGWDMWDAINTYVAQGTDGGLITFVLFLTLLIVAFRRLGIARKAVETSQEAKRLWILGCMLFAHTVAFWGIAYFDQSSVIWYTGLAMIGTAISMKTVKPDSKKPPLSDLSPIHPPMESISS
jgi:hypothetical protein